MGDAHLIDLHWCKARAVTPRSARWILRNRLEKMSATGEVLDCSTTPTTKAVEKRNAMLCQRLGLDQSTKSMADELYSNDDNAAEA